MAGTFNFTVRAQNSAGHAARQLTIVIAAATPVVHEFTYTYDTGGIRTGKTVTRNNQTTTHEFT